ncbi:MAG: PEP-CTERM sorting domain-containing protein, partial [Chthoniobacterales bacterium]
PKYHHLMKKLALHVAVLSLLTLSVHAAVGVAYVGNSTVGYFKSSANTELSLGGVAVGVFTNTLASGPSASFWTGISGQSGASAWSSILAQGFQDVRSMSPTGNPSDWLFPTNLAGTASGINITTLPANSRLYVIGFDNGSFSTATPSSSWSGAVEWGVVSAFGHVTSTENFLSPADLGTKSLNFGSAYNLVSGDVVVGSLAPGYGSTTRNVLLVPEPSTYALLAISGIGFAGYVIRRRRRA